MQKSKHRKRRDDDDDEPDREHVFHITQHKYLLRLCQVGVGIKALEIRPGGGFQSDEESSRRVHAWAGSPEPGLLESAQNGVAVIFAVTHVRAKGRLRSQRGGWGLA